MKPTDDEIEALPVHLRDYVRTLEDHGREFNRMCDHLTEHGATMPKGTSYESLALAQVAIRQRDELHKALDSLLAMIGSRQRGELSELHAYRSCIAALAKGSEAGLPVTVSLVLENLEAFGEAGKRVAADFPGLRQNAKSPASSEEPAGSRGG